MPRGSAAKPWFTANQLSNIMASSKKNILVTGGAGFIGSHLCKALVQKGHSVVAVDNFDPMYPRKWKEENVRPLKTHKRFTLIQADTRDRKKMEHIFAKHKFSHVFHLAGRGGLPQSKLNPFFYLDDIAMGTLVVLECAAKHGVKMVVNASTSSVYAQTKGKPSKETDDTDKPGSVYTASKKAAELLCHAYHVMYGIGIVNVRFFSVYGPGGRPDMIVYKFTKKILNNEQIFDVQPDPKRDFTCVSDIVSGLVACLKLPKDMYEVLNLGYGRPIAVSAFIKILEKTLGKKAIMGKHISPPPSDMAVTHADNSRAKKILKWKPKIRLEEGVKAFVAWYLQNR